MKETIKNYYNMLKDGTKQMFKEFFHKETNTKQRANMWTFMRLMIPFITLILSIIGIVSGALPLFIASGALAGFGAVTDYFDGKSARKHNSTSEYGKVLDAVSDKVYAGIIGINLLFINPMYLITLLGEIGIALVNTTYVLKNKDVVFTSSKLGKIKEWPLFLTLALGYLSPLSSALNIVSNVAIGSTFLVQAATATNYIKINNKKVEDAKNNIIDIETNNIETEEHEDVTELSKTNSISDRINALKEFKAELQDNNPELEKGHQKIKK